MYTEVFLGDAPEAAKPWISSHVAARKTVFTLADGTQVSADIVGDLDKDVVAQYVPDTSLLKEVVVGATVSSLDNGTGQLSTGTFSGCSALEKVTMQRETKTIDQAAFANCTSLSSVTLPNSISSIGSQAFYECSSLKQIALPCNISEIAMGTFGNCSSLEEALLGKNVSHFEQMAFAKTLSLKKLVFEHKTIDEVKAIDGFSDLSSAGVNFEIEALDGTFKF